METEDGISVLLQLTVQQYLDRLEISSSDSKAVIPGTSNYKPETQSEYTANAKRLVCTCQISVFGQLFGFSWLVLQGTKVKGTRTDINTMYVNE